MKKKIKILLVGCGSMGTAHLKSVLTFKKKSIYAVEKNAKKISILKNQFKNNQTIFSKNLPKNQNFDYAIIATHSFNRYDIIKKVLNDNQINYLLLEKFLFPKKNQYKKAKSIFKKYKVKVFVNIWSKLFIKICRIKKQKISSIYIKIRNGRVLTNLVHYLSILEELFSKKVEIIFDKSKFYEKKIGNNYFSEYSGKILLKKNSRQLGIISGTNKNYDSILLVKEKKKQEFLVKDKYIFEKDNDKQKTKYNFPLNSKTTKQILNNISSNKKKIVPSFNDAARTSEKIIIKSLRNIIIR